MSVPSDREVEAAAREIDYAAEMRLPEGVSCDQCQHTKRCFGLGFSTPGATSCDFYPSRFRTALQAAEAVRGE